MSRKSILVSPETKKKLDILRIEKNHKTMEDLIVELIRNYHVSKK